MAKRTDISSIPLLGGGAAVLMLAGCANPSEVRERDYVIDFADGFQQSDADAILHECKAEDISLVVQPSGQIEFKPQPTADYDASVCVLNYIKESGTTKFGFVGNEKYVSSDESE